MTRNWTDRRAMDPGVVLVELLAYVGELLSYYQDRLAAEAYLGTARRRTALVGLFLAVAMLGWRCAWGRTTPRKDAGADRTGMRP